MTHINLLPWRELKRQQEKKNFIVLMASAVTLTFLLMIMINYYCNSLFYAQTARNQRLQTEITTYDKQINAIKSLKKMRSALIAHMKIIQELQATRTLTVHLFNELIDVLPDGVYLTSVSRIKNKITLKGYTESNSNVSILMRNIENNPWLHLPKLAEIKKNKDTDNKKRDPNNPDDNEFSLTVTLGQLKKSPLKKGGHSE